MGVQVRRNRREPPHPARGRWKGARCGLSYKRICCWRLTADGGRLTAVGQVLDVTSGAKFYAPGKTYHQFAGTVRLRGRIEAVGASADRCGVTWEGLHARACAQLAQEGGKALHVRWMTCTRC